MKVTYMGRSDQRIIRIGDLPDTGLEEDLVWSTGQTLEVPDDVGEILTETMREDFKNRSDTTRDLRSKEELDERAKELQIKGRSKMDREELLQAVTAAEIELEELPVGDELIEGQGSTPEAPQEP